MSWLKSLTSKRAPPAAAPAPPPHDASPADDFLSDSLLPVEQERKRSKAALAADAAAASRVPLAVRMSESVTAGMTRALDSSNKGFAMLEKMGWKKEDGGLGASVRGAAEPIAVVIKRSREGLGCAPEAPLASAAASGSSCEALLKDFRSRRGAQAALAHTLSVISTARTKLVELHGNPSAPAPPAPLSVNCDVAARSSGDEYDPDVEYAPDTQECCPPPAPPSTTPSLPPPRIHVIDTSAAAAAAMSALELHDVFAVDLEGVELGRGGTIAILQVAVEAEDGACDVYIFDILQLGAEAFASGLGAMLGSSRALKLMFDARSDADALWHGWRVMLKGVFDVQVAHVLAFASNCRNVPSLLSVIESSDGVSETERLRARNAKTSGPTVGADGCYNSRVWLHRPIEASLLKYAAGDVAVLLPLYRHTSAALRLQLQSDDAVMLLSQQRIAACTDINAIRPRSSERDFYESFCADADAAFQLQRRLIGVLRERHCYCLWCKVAYSSNEEMSRMCPGADEDDH